MEVIKYIIKAEEAKVDNLEATDTVYVESAEHVSNGRYWATGNKRNFILSYSAGFLDSKEEAEKLIEKINTSYYPQYRLSNLRVVKVKVLEKTFIECPKDTSIQSFFEKWS